MLFLRSPRKPEFANLHIKGIIELYSCHATNIITMHEEQDSVEKISRTKIERQIMKQLDKVTFPIDYKISWYSAVHNPPLSIPSI